MTKSKSKRSKRDEAELEAAYRTLGIILPKIETLIKDLQQAFSTLEKMVANYADGWSDERVGQGGHKEWWALWRGPATRN
jgi:hypothetical protein